MKTLPEIRNVEIKAGSFTLGKNSFAPHERNVPMKITRPFYLMTHPVTQRQWAAVMKTRVWDGAVDKSEALREGDAFPAVGVSWHDAREFASKLSQMSGLNYRLPTDTEWEYAIRAGTSTKYTWGDEPSAQHGWCCDSFQDGAEPHLQKVAQLKPNPWGLYDMAGNVQEWVLDLCRPEPHSVHLNADHFPNEGTDFVSTRGWRAMLRNGSYASDSTLMRSSSRTHSNLSRRSIEVGFRLVVDADHSIGREMTVLDSPWDSPIKYLPLAVFWNQIDDNPPPTRARQIEVFWSYIKQIEEMDRDRAALREAHVALLAKMRLKKNIERMYKGAVALSKMWARFEPESVTKKELARLDLAAKRLLELMDQASQ